MPEYKCLECGEVFHHKSNCAIHHLNTNHHSFILVGTDIKIKIKESDFPTPSSKYEHLFK
jgi:hypothetical protein